jgi:hypothetical protein
MSEMSIETATKIVDTAMRNLVAKDKIWVLLDTELSKIAQQRMSAGQQVDLARAELYAAEAQLAALEEKLVKK